jgi:hypothetical protein
MTQQATTVEPRAKVRWLTLSKETVRQLADDDSANAHDRRGKCVRPTKHHFCNLTISCIFCSDVP